MSIGISDVTAYCSGGLVWVITCDTRKPFDNLSTSRIPVGIAYLDTTRSCHIHWDPFMHIYFRKIYKFIKTVHKSLSYNSLTYKILHVKSSFLQKGFSKPQFAFLHTGGPK